METAILQRAWGRIERFGVGREERADWAMELLNVVPNASSPRTWCGTGLILIR